MDNAHRLHNTVYARLEAITAAEKITRVELGHLSRELLVYVCDTQDIDIVNRLLNAVTAVNKRALILYFGHFLPWTQEVDKQDKFERFGKKMLGDKKLTNKAKAIEEWLADEANNIWTWQADNLDMNKKKDFAGSITKDIKKALAGDEKTDTEALTMMQIMQAILLGGVSIEDMLEAAGDIELANQQANPVMKDVTPTEKEVEPNLLAA
jgi:hypothetical protein